MSQTRETWADNWRSSEPITYGLTNDAYVGLQGLPFFGDLLERGGSPNASNLDGTISQDPIGSFINTASMFFGGSAGNALVKRIGGRVFRWFNKFVPWRAARGVSVIGPRATYREFAKKMGANFLNVTDDAWTMRKNVKFLQDVVKRGDDVIFAGKYNPAKLDPSSVLAQEIRYLQRHGYSWNKDFTRLIKQ